MPLPRLPAYAGLVLAVAALSASAGAGARSLRPAIVAAGSDGAVVSTADGSWRVELPWLLPGDGDAAVSPDGRRLAFASARTGNREIYVADAVTSELTRVTASRSLDDGRPVWSPDGSRIAWEVGPAGRRDVYVMRSDGTHKRRLAGGPGDEAEPAWSPDGTRIVFASDRGGIFELWTVARAGGTPQPVLGATGTPRDPAWSPDGRRLAYAAADVDAAGIWLVDLASGETRRLTRSSGSDVRPDWSPDGRRIAFTRIAGSVRRTWLADYRNGPARPLPGSDGDLDPDWALASPALAPGPDQLLPDLDQQAPAGLVVLARNGGFHLGFDSAVDSVGSGPLRIRGWRPPGSRTMRADQVIERRGGGALLSRGVGALRYEAHPPHRHWHFQAFEGYELRRASDHELVGRDHKTGFCLIDRYGRASVRVPRAGPPRFVSDCGARQPDLRRVEQGSSPGYVDRYPAFFHGQDIELTGVPTGIYVLVHRANPTRRLRELRYSNNTASVRVRLAWPGGRAQPPSIAVLRRCEASERCPG